EPLRVAQPDHLALVPDRPVLPLAPEDVLVGRFAASSGREELAQQRDRGLDMPAGRLVEGGDERGGGLDPRGQREETPHVVPGEPPKGSTAGWPAWAVVFRGRAATRLGHEGAHQRLGAMSSDVPLGAAGAEILRARGYLVLGMSCCFRPAGPVRPSEVQASTDMLVLTSSDACNATAHLCRGARRATVSARTARIGERAGELDAETTVGVDRASGGVGQLAESASVARSGVRPVTMKQSRFSSCLHSRDHVIGVRGSGVYMQKQPPCTMAWRCAVRRVWTAVSWRRALLTALVTVRRARSAWSPARRPRSFVSAPSPCCAATLDETR